MTRDEVWIALDQAMDNGYDLRGWDTDTIAVDLADFCPGLEGMSEDELRPHIESWKAKAS